jgi:hypothetical protein
MQKCMLILAFLCFTIPQAQAGIVVGPPPNRTDVTAIHAHTNAPFSPRVDGWKEEAPEVTLGEQWWSFLQSLMQTLDSRLF